MLELLLELLVFSITNDVLVGGGFTASVKVLTAPVIASA